MTGAGVPPDKDTVKRAGRISGEDDYIIGVPRATSSSDSDVADICTLPPAMSTVLSFRFAKNPIFRVRAGKNGTTLTHDYARDKRPVCPVSARAKS